MTSRERWTVYPLLFLAIGLAVRSVAVPQGEFAAATVGSLEATRLVCREIVIEGDDGTVLVHMGRVVGGGGGRIELKDKDGVDAIAVGSRPEGRDGFVEFFDAAGEPAGEISAPQQRTAWLDGSSPHAVTMRSPNVPRSASAGARPAEE